MLRAGIGRKNDDDEWYACGDTPKKFIPVVLKIFCFARDGVIMHVITYRHFKNVGISAATA
jgi:hypothetical protein